MVFNFLRRFQNKTPAHGTPKSGESSVGELGTDLGAEGGDRDDGRPESVTSFVVRARKLQSSGTNPTEKELFAYAQYLGIDLLVDDDLFWIVDESIKAPLPPEWSEHKDTHGRVWYHNQLTRKNTWTHPLESFHREVYQTIVRYRGDLSPYDQRRELAQCRQKLEELERETRREMQAWSDHVNVNGQRFFFNRVRNWSSRTDPRSAADHELALQTRVLKVLGEWAGRNRVQPLCADLKQECKEPSRNDAQQQSQGPLVLEDVADDVPPEDFHETEMLLPARVATEEARHPVSLSTCATAENPGWYS